MKNINDRDKVRFKNLRPWDISFRAVIYPEDVVVAGNMIMTRLSVAEIYEQIQRGNSCFLGVDGYGKHAPFRILDADQYRYLFGLDENAKLPEQMDEALVDSLLKIKDREKYSKRLDEILLTSGDKRQLAHIIANRIDLDGLPMWQINAITAKTGQRFDN